MKVFVLLLMWSAYTCLYCQVPIDSVINRLEKLPSYQATVLYSISQPLTDDVVDYTLDVATRQVPSDTLGGTEYYMEVVDGHPAVKGNFYCYSSGNYFNFANQRLREYHASENAEPFRPRQSDDYIIPGIHQSGLFVSELPNETAKELRRLCNNPEAKMTVSLDSAYGEPSSITVSVVEQKNDLPLREIIYKFDAKTYLPKYKEIINSPGHVASQTLTTRYEETIENPLFPDDYFTEVRLLREKPEIMASFRKSNFRADRLKGHLAPEFSLPVLSDENKRFVLAPGKDVTVLLFADTKASFCLPAIEQLDSLCREEGTELRVLFKESSRSDVEKYWGEALSIEGEPLYNASNTSIQYGVVGFPTVFLLTPENRISEVYIGYSPDLTEKLANSISLYRDSCKTDN